LNVQLPDVVIDAPEWDDELMFTKFDAVSPDLPDRLF
jgi:hypothetical protein